MLFAVPVYDKQNATVSRYATGSIGVTEDALWTKRGNHNLAVVMLL